MLSVALIWIYMFLTTYLTGFGVLTLLAGLFCRGRKMAFVWDACVMAGIAVVTMYAQAWSLFGGVGAAANAVLAAVSVCCVAVWRRERSVGKAAAVRLRRCLPYALLFLVMAYGTSHGYFHYDTTLYHAQAIRWVEEYGVVPGLGNFHLRLAYNSAAFPLTALYSFAFLGGQSYHAAAGFLAWVVACVCVDLKTLFMHTGGPGECADNTLRGASKRTWKATHNMAGRFPAMAARLVAVYYLCNIYDEMISPASDYFVSLLMLYIVIRWLDLCGRSAHPMPEVDAAATRGGAGGPMPEVDAKTSCTMPEMATPDVVAFPYALLCLLSVCAMTMKLSAVPLLLLALRPAAILARGGGVRGSWTHGDEKFVSEKHMEGKSDEGADKDGTNASGNNKAGIADGDGFGVASVDRAGAADDDKACVAGGKAIMGYLLCGCILLVPFLARNVILSGWLLYPFPALDLFSFDWKIPAGEVLYDAREIAVFGRGYSDVAAYELPRHVWLPEWFAAAGRSYQAALLADLAGLFVLAVHALRKAAGYMRIHGRKPINDADAKKHLPGTNGRNGDFAAVERELSFLLAVLYAELAFWFFSAPLIRYGTVIVLLPAAVIAGGAAAYINGRTGSAAEEAKRRRLRMLADWEKERSARKLLNGAALVLISLFLLYKGARLLVTETRQFQPAYLIKQTDYPNAPTKAYACGGLTFYAPSEGDQTGYAPFPSAPPGSGFVLRGEGLADGFRAVR